MIRRTVSLTEENQPMITSLVVTVIGPDRPGIVSLLSAKAQGVGANWAGSRMASLAGQFAGMVHFEVPPENADALAAALQALESADLKIVIEKSGGSAVPTGRRVVKLEVVGHDRPGIVRDLSGALAQRGVSIIELHTEIVSGAMTAEHLFKVKTVLLVPQHVSNDEVRHALEALANEMMVDIALGDHVAGGTPAST
jgi:glycine cleavage system regulatory protein